MAKDTRHKNTTWNLPTNANGSIATWDAVHFAVLMDIRDELQTLNAVFRCSNFLAVPQLLHDIKRNTTRRKRLTPVKHSR